MAQLIEISYYNSFILAGGTTTNASTTNKTHNPGVYHIEEARIKGEFNGKSVDFGARAYATDDEYNIRRRSNAMIYSGIYNSKTKVNKTNEFPIGDAITRAVDIAHGSIQKLHAEETNLNIFQENKVSRALIDKDAIFTAEGGALTVSGSKVIGQVVAYAGKYGISTNPESFAVFGTRKYFSDKNRGVILRLSQDGLTPISAAGMKDFFRDNLKITNAKIYGMYDEVYDQYYISMQKNSPSNNITHGSFTTDGSTLSAQTDYVTLSYSEKSGGWVSLHTFKPTFGFSLANEFYTFNAKDIYKHYDADADYNKFYGSTYQQPSYVEFIMNDMPSSIKTFKTINYEGTTGWAMESGKTENVSKEGYTFDSQVEEAYKIPKKGVTITDENNMLINVGFELKESKYYKDIRQKVPYASGDYNSKFNTNTLNTTTGIKGYHAQFKLQYWEPNAEGNNKAELFAVSNEITL